MRVRVCGARALLHRHGSRRAKCKRRGSADDRESQFQHVVPPESKRITPRSSRWKALTPKQGQLTKLCQPQENIGSIVILLNVLITPEATWQHYVAETSSQRS